jgi:4-methyl-5(b-hydroxyethyl)-thiazole monophosphate biosynthesis
MKILFVINDLFEESETINPYNVLKRCGYEVEIASKKKECVGSHGIHLSNLTILDTVDYSSYDLVVLPGGPQYIKNQEDYDYLNLINYYIKNKALACICATPTILGHLGLLRNKKYTCFPPMNEDFGGTFTGEASTIDGNLITGRGAGSSLEFAYKIVEYLEGIEKVNKVKQDMFY